MRRRGRLNVPVQQSQLEQVAHPAMRPGAQSIFLSCNAVPAFSTKSLVPLKPCLQEPQYLQWRTEHVVLDHSQSQDTECVWCLCVAHIVTVVLEPQWGSGEASGPVCPSGCWSQLCHMPAMRPWASQPPCGSGATWAGKEMKRAVWRQGKARLSHSLYTYGFLLKTHQEHQVEDMLTLVSLLSFSSLESRLVSRGEMSSCTSQSYCEEENLWLMIAG